MGCVVPLQALAWSVPGRTMENAAVRSSRVLVSVVPACPMGMARKSTLPNYFLRAATTSEYFLGFFACFLSHPRSRENPKSTAKMRVHDVLSKLVKPGSGVSGTPLAYMKSGVVPWPVSKRACVSSGGSTHGGIWLDDAVYSTS